MRAEAELLIKHTPAEHKIATKKLPIMILLCSKFFVFMFINSCNNLYAYDNSTLSFSWQVFYVKPQQFMPRERMRDLISRRVIA